MLQKLQINIPDYMKERVEILRTEVCGDCNKEFKVIKVNHAIGTETISEDCPHCLIEKENEEIRKQARESQIRAKLDRCARYSEVPFELEGTTFEDYTPTNSSQTNAKEISLQFANEQLDKTTLFFQGDTGLGKTHLSYCVYQSFVKRQKGAIFIDLPSLLSDIRNTYNSRNDNQATTQEQIIKAISDCELFVLDDIGAEYVKPDANGYESWAADILFQIANARQGKKNIYTTNFTSKHLTQKYGMMSKRIISRLMSNAKVIKVEGDDHRLKGLD